MGSPVLTHFTYNDRPYSVMSINFGSQLNQVIKIRLGAILDQNSK